MKKLTREQKRQIAVIAAKKDADIDLSDAPEVVDWSAAEMGRFSRPGKKPVTMRLDTDLVDWLKSYGPGYQTRVNHLLRHAMTSALEGRRKGRKSA
ncbi:MAG: BrnA antitoxin family protein [Acidobacteriota bacterium]